MKKPTDILGLVELIKTMALNHYAIADFRHDLEINFDDNIYDYPLLFLEAEKQIIGNREENTNTYTISIQLCDIPEENLTQSQAKLEYIMNDMVRELTKLQVKLSDTNSLDYSNMHGDGLVVKRTEFTLQLGKSNTGYGNPFKN